MYEPFERELSLQGEARLVEPRAKAKDQETYLTIELRGCFVAFLGRGKLPQVSHLPLPLL